MNVMDTISWKDFKKVDLRVGTIMEVNDFPEAQNPSYILRVDFGDTIGVKKSSAQITDLYDKEDLVGKQVLGVVNFPPKQVGPIMSECLVTGFHRENGDVSLAVPDLEVPNGTKLA
ncbi:MAG: tRNA-binding protein [Fodinibius sp.]|nr:tRNA-binding protein [Fodinibius sp.]